LLLYYITDRSQFPGDETARRRRLLETIGQAIRHDVDFIQLREKDLSPRELEGLTCKILELWAANKRPKTRLLINSRTDIALACGAHGVHLRSNDVSPSAVRGICTPCGQGTLARLTIGVSCHAPAEVAAAAVQGADFAVFGPVFQKIAAPGTPPAGLAPLHQACREAIPVLALGGINPQNARACLQEGAAGIAGIRLFQENEMERVVGELRRPISGGRGGALTG
jgi:thiamine-phosphate pyrophosphorylase